MEVVEGIVMLLKVSFEAIFIEHFMHTRLCASCFTYLF